MIKSFTLKEYVPIASGSVGDVAKFPLKANCWRHRIYMAYGIEDAATGDWDADLVFSLQGREGLKLPINPSSQGPISFSLASATTPVENALLISINDLSLQLYALPFSVFENADLVTVRVNKNGIAGGTARVGLVILSSSDDRDVISLPQ